MKKFMIFLALSFMIFTGSLNAMETIIENAEDNTTIDWSVYDNSPAGATISNVIDAEQGNVIELSGSGTANGYMLGHWGSNGFQLQNKNLSWKMKYDEMFSVYIIVKTEDGNRYLWYTAEDDNRGLVLGGRYIHHGLGADAVNGQWQTFSRDLEADLQKYSPDLHVLEIKAFLVRGSGRIDDITSMDNIMQGPALTRAELRELIKDWAEDPSQANADKIINANVSAITDMSWLFFNMDFNLDISKWDVSNVTRMDYMFGGLSTFDQNLSSWNVSNVTNMYAMFGNYSSLSTENYDALLIGWSKLNLQSNVRLDANLLTYSSAGKIARDRLVNTYNWQIIDLGIAVNPIFEECSTNIDSTILKHALILHPEDFIATTLPQHPHRTIGLIQGDTFFFKIDIDNVSSRLFRVNCKDHSKVDELFYETQYDRIDYVGSIGEVAYFSNYHDGAYFGTPFSISEGENLQRIPFISSFLSERNLFVAFNGLRIVDGNLELNTSDSKTYIFSPDGTLLGSRP